MEERDTQAELNRTLLVFGKAFGKKAIEADTQKRVMLDFSHKIALLFTNPPANSALLRIRRANVALVKAQRTYWEAWTAANGPDQLLFPDLEQAIKDATAEKSDAAANALDVLSELVGIQYAAALTWAMSEPDLMKINVENADMLLFHDPIEEG